MISKLAALITLAVVVVADGAAATSNSAVRLVVLPKGQLQKCVTSELLRPACPRLVPRVDGAYRALFARDGNLAPAAHVFNLEFFVASERPPKGAHVASAAGAVWRLTPYADPTPASKVLSIRTPVDVDRKRPVSFGPRTWNGRHGVLYLAPPHLYGGMFGDHLVFQWERGQRTYVLSLHTWWPLPETAATLRAMVLELGS